MDDDISYTSATLFRRLAIGHAVAGVVGLVALLIDNETSWFVLTVAGFYGALLCGSLWLAEALNEREQQGDD